MFQSPRPVPSRALRRPTERSHAIAVVGAGISGLVAAASLSREHRVTLFEAGDHLGGHAHTVEVAHEGRRLAVDTGFMVFNEVTYPGFTGLLAELGVSSRPSDMSFSVRNDATGLEYCGSSLATLFAQPGNLLRPSFFLMLREVARFNRLAPELAVRGPELTLREILAAGGFGPFFRDHYLVPMTAAIWSATPDQVLEMPASFLVRFLANHGLLTIDGQFQWRTVVGGSSRYVEALARPLRHRVRLATPVVSVLRLGRDPTGGGVQLVTAGGRAEVFDRVVLAVHADRALELVVDATATEREILGAFPYQVNEGLLHTDPSLLPRALRARASWNYHLEAPGSGRDRGWGGVTLTYDLSRLQGLPGSTPVLLTLNRSDRVDPARVIRSFDWEHPRYTLEGIRAQRRRREVSGVDRIHYCGAYWGNGFHEDGLASGLAVTREVAEAARTAPVGRSVAARVPAAAGER